MFSSFDVQFISVCYISSLMKINHNLTKKLLNKILDSTNHLYLLVNIWLRKSSTQLRFLLNATVTGSYRSLRPHRPLLCEIESKGGGGSMLSLQNSWLVLYWLLHMGFNNCVTSLSVSVYLIRHTVVIVNVPIPPIRKRRDGHLHQWDMPGIEMPFS